MSMYFTVSLAIIHGIETKNQPFYRGLLWLCNFMRRIGPIDICLRFLYT